MPRPRVRYDACQDILPIVSYLELNKSWGEKAAKICAAFRASNNYKEWKEDRKECNGVKTPVLKVAPISITTEHLSDLPYTDIWTPVTPEGEIVDEPVTDGEFFYSLQFWVGIEEKNNQKQCIWFGIDQPAEDITETVTLACGKIPCNEGPVPVGDIHTLVEDVLNQLHDAVDKDTAIDLVLGVVFVLIAAALVVVIAYAASVAAGIVIGGVILLGGGSAIVS